ncbi:MAG: EamA family transporter [Chloroflexi bacterium]|jgi:drug/metabolite transporter, DME family|nr:EamA family transporter [Chloroflexota bacterium]
MYKFPGEIWIILAAVLWGTTGTSQTFAPQGATPISIGAVRLALGGLALLVFSRWRGQSLRGIRWPLATTLLSGLSMAAYNLFFFAGVAKTGVATGTIVTIGSAPILAGLMGWFVRKERPGWKWGLATALAVGGGIVLVAPGEQVSIDPLGVVFALLSGLAYATFAVASKNLLERVQPEAAMAVVFCLGAVLLSPLLFTQDLSWLAEPSGWMVALHLGLFATAAAYLFFGNGLKTVPVAKATTLTLSEPLTASLLGIFVLGERFNPSAGLGIGLIFIGLAILSIQRKPRRVHHESS